MISSEGKLWGGRFKEKTDKLVEKFTESVSFDWRLWKYDIKGSIAHTKMLAKKNIISKKDAEIIIKGLKHIEKEIEEGKFQWKEELEDVHMNIESALIEKIGSVGGKLHTARSRNDQIALDLRLYLREETKEILNLIKEFQKALVNIAQQHIDSIMPGYTHLQHAQPVTLGHYILAYVEMFQRDKERFLDNLKRINKMPLGACALAGSTLPIDRDFVAEILEFDGVLENSMDAVSDRDFILEFLSIASITMMHLSRFSEELILWSTMEFSFIELPDAFTTGSSIMPQKKNPDVLELIRGKTGRVYGALISLLTTMKGLPLTYNRDMQEDKIPLFDTVDTLKQSLKVVVEMLPKIKFNTSQMKKVAPEGFTLATDIAEYLVSKGVPFRKAHEQVGKLVRYAIEKSINLEQLTIEELKKFLSIVDSDIFDAIDLKKAVIKRNSIGGTSPLQVKKQIEKWKKLLSITF